MPAATRSASLTRARTRSSRRSARGRTRRTCSARSPTPWPSTSPGGRLFVCNGTQNAVAVFDFEPGKSSLRGLIPVGWFPGARRLRPAAARRSASPTSKASARPNTSSPASPSNSTRISTAARCRWCRCRTARELARLTQTALDNLRYGLLQEAKLPAAPGPAAAARARARRRAERLQARRLYHQGEPHLRPGAGRHDRRATATRRSASSASTSRPTSTSWPASSSCSTTPTAPASSAPMATSGPTAPSPPTTWSGPSPASRAAIPTAWSDDDVDALAYSPGGFIWDNAIAHGKTLRDYGEFAITEAHWRDTAEEARARLPGLLPRLRQPDRRDRDLQPARHRIAAALPGHQHRRLGH